MVDIVQSIFLDDPVPVCASERYLRSWSDDYGWFVDAQFVLPFYVLEWGSFRHIVITAETLYRDPTAPIEQERAFLNGVVAASARIGIDFISQPKTTSVFKTFPDGATYISWGAYRLELSPAEDALFASVHAHHRRAIRKAMRDGVVVERGSNLMAACHEIIQQTLQRQGKPCLSLGQFRAFRDHLRDNADFYVAMHKGVPHAAGLLISDSNSAFYILGGTRARPHHGAGTLLHWTAMLDMKKKGVKVYDFVGGRVHPASGSKQEGLQVFKSRFGTHFHRGYLWKYPIRPWKYRLYYSYRRFRDFVQASRYHEDMIDNEIRTAALPRSPLFSPTGDGARV